MREPSSASASRFDQISTRVSLLTQPQALLQRYGRAIRGYLEALLPPEDADEAARDFTVRILAGRFAHWTPGQGRFRDFLKTSVYHAAIDFLRKKTGREKQVEDLTKFPDPTGRTAHVWLDLYRAEVLAGARAALKAYQDEHPGNVFHTLVQLMGEDTGDDSEELARRLSQATDRRYEAGNVRQQVHRARRKLAELVLDEIASTLDDPTPQQIEEELCILSLMPYVSEFLPPDWRTRGRQHGGG